MISIIVPVYNVKKYLDRCIKSILNQTYKDLELILVDDGSTDGSNRICDKYAMADKRVTVIHKKNAGVSTARNAGIDTATGEFITFVDADDWIDDKLYEIVLSNFTPDVDVVAFNGKVIYQSGKTKAFLHIDHEEVISSFEAIERVNYTSTIEANVWSKVYRKSLFNNIRFPHNITIGEDYKVVCDVFMAAGLVKILPYDGYNYFQRVNSVSYRGYQGKSRRIIDNYRNVRDALIQHDTNLKESALAYFTLQMMAVVISMVKSGIYNKEIILDVQNEVRHYLTDYLRNSRVQIYLKCCAILLSINYHCLTIPYKVFFVKRRGA